LHIADVLLGRRLRTAEEASERIGPLRGVPLLGLDALSSAAYGPEALLTVLLPLGGAGLRYVVPLTLVIVAVLAAVALSYRQTIAAYPKGGGSYTVSKENLGRTGSLFAAAALGLDYVLTVAVGISAGVGAVTSAIPSLLPHTLSLALAVLLVITLVNMRGARASGGLFALPTLAFVVSLAVVIVVGLVRAVAHGASPSPVVAPPPPPAATVAVVTPWLLMRAFANGTTAMTGVEAVSNAVPLFRKPSVQHARQTLIAVVLLLMALLVGIALLCRAYHVMATLPGQAGYESVLSQLTEAVLGRGPAYAFCMASVFAVLVFSANTSFTGFPIVAEFLAEDRFLPAPFEHRGRRLVFTYGILVLCALSALLLVAFDGVTDRLIPLYAIGALLAFTLSQTGMVVYWHKRHVHGPRLWVNAIGAIATGVTVVIVTISKFVEGAWISMLVILALVALFASLRAHYERIERAICTNEPLAVGTPPCALALVPMQQWNKVTARTLRWALGFTPDVVAVQVLIEHAEDDLEDRWPRLVEPLERAGRTPPKLVVLRSDYRRLLAPLVAFIAKVAAEHPDRQLAVVVPQLVEYRWYRALVPFDLAAVLRSELLVRGGPPIVIVSAPWDLRDWVSAEAEKLASWPSLRGLAWPRRRRGLP
jgi:amino acid transporter